MANETIIRDDIMPIRTIEHKEKTVYVPNTTGSVQKTEEGLSISFSSDSDRISSTLNISKQTRKEIYRAINAVL